MNPLPTIRRHAGCLSLPLGCMSLIVGTLATLAAILVVPECRIILGLDDYENEGSELIEDEPTAPFTRVTIRKIEGAWRRIDFEEDTDYVLNFQTTFLPNKEGYLEAKYFNPCPINVGRVLINEGSNDIFSITVILDDVNYLGSTYTLTYTPNQDSLRGSYVVGDSGEQFQVTFRRTSGTLEPCK